MREANSRRLSTLSGAPIADGVKRESERQRRRECDEESREYSGAREGDAGRTLESGIAGGWLSDVVRAEKPEWDVALW